MARLARKVYVAARDYWDLALAAVKLTLVFLVWTTPLLCLVALVSCEKHAPVDAPKVTAREHYSYLEQEDGSFMVWVHGQGGASEAREEICTTRRAPCTVETGGQIIFIRPANAQKKSPSNYPGQTK